MGLRFEGRLRGDCLLVRVCAEGISEELTRIWSRPADFGSDDVTKLHTVDGGFNIQWTHRACRGDLDWCRRSLEHQLAHGLESRDALSALYGGSNLGSVILAYWTAKERGDEETAALARRWVRARLTIAALMAAPHRVTQATWVQPPGGRDTGPGEHWRQGPSVLRAGSRVNRQVAVQEAVSDLLCAAIEWPGWADRRLEERVGEYVRHEYPRDTSESEAEGWMPSYLDPILAVTLLGERLGLSVADTCGLTGGERFDLRRIIDGGNDRAANIAVREYLDGIPCHPGFRAIHFLRDEDSVATVIESNASRNKPTATVSVARWRETPDGMRCTMETHTPAPFRGTGAANVESEIASGTILPWARTRIVGEKWSNNIPIPRGDVWHYRWTAQGWELVKGGGSSGVDRPGPVDGGGGDPRPSPPPPPPEPKPPKPQPRPGWWRRLLRRLRGLLRMEVLGEER